MMINGRARIWFGLNALVVLVGFVVQMVVAADENPKAFFHTPLKRLLNVFCFFTIQSTLIVGATSLALAVGWARPTTWFRTLRLIGVVGIALTFVVFQTVLRKLQDLTGQAAFADLLLHSVSPLMCVGGWLWFGPRRQTSPRVVWLTLSFLVAWGTFTLIRGHIIGFYPYAFMNPTESGYARVSVNLVIVAAVFVAFAAGAHLLDRRLPNRHVDPAA
jgi:hypothetical protein